jgi:acetyl esterase/lipase
MKKNFILCVFLYAVTAGLHAQKVMPLYSGAIPNAVPNTMKEESLQWDGKFGGYKSVSKPTLQVFLPPKNTATGAAVVICPGGGYMVEAYADEGITIANTFTKHGVAAFVLKYRLPSDSIMEDKSIGPLQDAQQAIKLVRQHANEWGVDTAKVGIMGFSAGGHLAASAGTHFDSSFIPNAEQVNLRPSFMVLIYPVISLTDKLTHTSSRRALLGNNPSAEKINFLSAEMQVTANTPPTWLTQTTDDKIVDVENSIVFYEALKAHNIQAEMHIYPKGDHGFVLHLPTEQWMHPLFEWMKANNWIKQRI